MFVFATLRAWKRCAAIREAIQTQSEETQLSSEVLFGDRALQVGQMSPEAALAAGIIEGAAIAFGLTAVQLLDELGLG